MSNRNQFFYTRTVRRQVEGVEGVDDTVVEQKFRDSFNLDMVIRSVTLETGEVVLLLNDLHEQYTQQPIVNPNTNKVKGYKEVKNIVQSEITLSPEDGARFWQVTNVENSYESYINSNSCSTTADEERRLIIERSNS